MKCRKDVREVIRYAQSHGFDIEGLTGSGHWRMKHPTGGLLIVAATPRGYRWRQNARAQIRRIISKLEDEK